MNRKRILFFVSMLPVFVSSQNILDDALDSLYREDQIYFGVTYNSFINSPEAFSQTNFSPALKMGIIRDFPINSRRNTALGIGLGYAFNSYIQNLKISTAAGGEFNYEFLVNQNYQKNRFSHQAVEIPFEFRWRTSTAESDKFWRIYAGFKASYTFSSKSIFKSGNQTATENNLALTPWQYGLTLSAGYNNWNAYFYYGLNPVFENAYAGQTTLEMRVLKVGLMFYFL